jgi:flagellar biosynthesis protein FlhA
MNGLLDLISLKNAANLKNMAGPILVVMILAMMVLPLPPFLLDILFTFNISVSVIVLMLSINTTKPLDFSSFPAVILIATLLRLSLNVASARVVLLHGHEGEDAAGKVIGSFGHFLVGGNYAIGIVVFIILVIINFYVITHGAHRIAQVGARFTLDAMPGKQMAIDADLNSGLIGEDEAKRRRAELTQEADFFGAMDGAGAFVVRDAMAGVMVMLINIIGGLIVGVVQHGLDISVAAKTYTLLTIGDGLVAQIPSLMISTAAGLMVARVNSEENVSQQFLKQLFTNPQILFLAALIIGGLGIIPGMPHFPFILLAGSMAFLAYFRNKLTTAAKEPPKETEAPAQEAQEVSWNDVSVVDVLGLDVGYRLIALVDKAQAGELLKRIKGIRKKFAQDIGFLPPSVHIRDNLELKPNAYKISLNGVEVGSGDVYPGMHLAINPGRVTGMLPGTVTKDPAFGLPAVWIEAGMRDQAQIQGYTVVDASTVVATHLNHLIHKHSSELLGREELQKLLDHVSRDMPKMVEDLTPKLLPLSVVQKVLQNLLGEDIPIRDMRSILESLIDHASKTQDAEELTNLVRARLSRSIVQQIAPLSNEIQVIAIDPKLEKILLQAVQSGSAEAAIEPGLADALLKEANAVAQDQERMGIPPVLLVPAQLRMLLSKFLRRAIPQLKVLSHTEVPDTKSIKVTAVLGGRA